MLNLEKQKHYLLFGSCVWVFPSIEKTLFEYILQDWHRWVLGHRELKVTVSILGQGLTERSITVAHQAPVFGSRGHNRQGLDRRIRAGIGEEVVLELNFQR